MENDPTSEGEQIGYSLPDKMLDTSSPTHKSVDASHESEHTSSALLIVAKRRVKTVKTFIAFSMLSFLTDMGGLTD